MRHHFPKQLFSPQPGPPRLSQRQVQVSAYPLVRPEQVPSALSSPVSVLYSPGVYTVTCVIVSCCASLKGTTLRCVRTFPLSALGVHGLLVSRNTFTGWDAVCSIKNGINGFTICESACSYPGVALLILHPHCGSQSFSRLVGQVLTPLVLRDHPVPRWIFFLLSFPSQLSQSADRIFLHKSSSVSLTPSPSANFFIVSLFVFQQFLEPSDGKIRNGTFQACNSESTISRLYIDHHIQDLIWQVQEALHLSTDLCVQTL